MSIATMIDRAAPGGVSEGDKVVICDRRSEGGIKITLSYDGDWFSAWVLETGGRGWSGTGRSREGAVSEAVDAYLDSLPISPAPAEVREADTDSGAEELVA